MITISDEQYASLDAVLPTETLKWLRHHRLPETLCLYDIKHVFRLEMNPLLNGEVFQIGASEHGSIQIGLQRITGHFGYVVAKQGQKKWAFTNSSIECFLLCFAASEHLWQMQRAKLINGKSRWEWLKQEFQKIDPAVFDDSENVWAFMVEELRNGII